MDEPQNDTLRGIVEQMKQAHLAEDFMLFSALNTKYWDTWMMFETVNMESQLSRIRLHRPCLCRP